MKVTIRVLITLGNVNEDAGGTCFPAKGCIDVRT